jgi:uncharacterized protein (TIGR02145 family)
MKIRRAIFTFLVWVALCPALALNISGVVKTNEGSGLEGVMVRLGKADLATTTGSDGSFRLTANGTGVTIHSRHAAFRGECPVLLEGNRLFFNTMEQAEVKAGVYDCKGRLLVSYGKVAASGRNSIALPIFGSGIHIHRVSVNHEQYVFMSVADIATNRGPMLSGSRSFPAAKQAKATSQFDDALLFTKTGYQLSRLALKKPDTSGIQITMTPLVTGTVKDAEGNTYQTVQIGNQVWTAENLRSTKYNDGAGISSGSYCFYNNTTDAAARKKWGAIYNFTAATSGKLAPTGWHVATDADWTTMEKYLIAHGYNYDGTTDSNKIGKSLCAQTDWEVDTHYVGTPGKDLSKNNASGFSAVPAGYRTYDGTFTSQNEMGFFWTATQQDASFGLMRYLWSVNVDCYRSDRVKSTFCSVRLVKNN